MSQSNKKQPRQGCKDLWNSFMCDGALFTENDIPYCPTTSKKLPEKIILWDDAKAEWIHSLSNGSKTFHSNAYVCFYQDDYKFDGARGIWSNSSHALQVLKHFEGVITPDFSTYQDFPEPLKLYNTYRMRAFGYWLGKNGISVINNVRWGSPETYWYCWDGIPKKSVVAIGTVGGSPNKLIDRQRFNAGIYEMVNVLHPVGIIVYGSANYPCFEKLANGGIIIRSYPSKTSMAFRQEIMHE